MRRVRPALLALLLALPLLAGCASPPPAAPPEPEPPPGAPVVPFADILAQARAFNGTHALRWVETQVLEPAPTAGFAPCPPSVPRTEGAVTDCLATRPHYRIPGTDGNNKTALDLLEGLQRANWTARLDNFTATFQGQPVPAHNVVAERAGSGNRTLYLGAHYDTRPCADKDRNPENRSKPVLGANDGASGAADLLVLAELLGHRAMNLTLRIVLFDAEDMGDGGHGCGAGTAWAQGSAHYAKALSAQEVARARGMVLLDMVGDPALELRREGYSASSPHRALQDELWGWAKGLGHGQFRDEASFRVTDDHVPFQERGIPAVDVIHLDGGPDFFPDTHHTAMDDLEHVSPASLEAAGETLLAAVLAWDAREGGAFVSKS